MTDRALETTAVFRELMAELTGLDGKFFDGPVPLADEQSVLEGYKWIFSILRVALDVNVWAGPARPRFVDIVGPHKKGGGGNADAVYLSLPVCGGPRDGRYSERIVGTINDRTLDIAPDGAFELTLSPREHAGAWLRLDAGRGAAL